MKNGIALKPVLGLVCFSRFFLLCLSFSLSLKADPIKLYKSYAGNLNFVTAGATLRTNSNTNNPCSVTQGPVNAVLSGIPDGATVKKALLYWAGSGPTMDSSVTFQGQSLNADRTFSDIFYYNNLVFDYFSGFKDVTNQVAGNATYSFGDLSVETTGDYCRLGAVLSGWALIVIYEEASEDFRVINVFDGLQQYWGSSLVLTPNNFVVPSSPVNGKLSVLTWEGDDTVSNAANNQTESIRVNGTNISDLANPLGNQFNSTINTYDNSNSYYGVDFDTFDISTYLSPGDTSVNSVYSSGQDLVFLSAEVISVTNTPVSDFSITTAPASQLLANQNASYSHVVRNNGPLESSGLVTVTSTLPTELDYVGASGSGWTCGHSSGTITCTRSDNLAVNTSYPAIVVNVYVREEAYPDVTYGASVSSANFDNVTSNNVSNDTSSVIGPDLSSSVKNLQDLNGGENNAGDTIRYTITLDNSSAATAMNVQVLDDISLGLENLSLVSMPSGAQDFSTGSSTGANGQGLLDVRGIVVPANGSTTIIFDVQIAASAEPGDLINNQATIVTPIGVGASPSSSTLIISPSLVAASGNKHIYIKTDPPLSLSRSRPTENTNNLVDGNNVERVFSLNPTLSRDLEIETGQIPLNVYLRRAGNNNANRSLSFFLSIPMARAGGIA